jgi:hypothetical protein
VVRGEGSRDDSTAVMTERDSDAVRCGSRGNAVASGDRLALVIDDSPTIKVKV